jgi:hypothetical protein
VTALSASSLASGVLSSVECARRCEEDLYEIEWGGEDRDPDAPLRMLLVGTTRGTKFRKG